MRAKWSWKGRHFAPLKCGPYWTAIDGEQCDASHEWSDSLFIALLLKVVVPRAHALRRRVTTLIAGTDSHWRSKSVATKQSTDQVGQLPSGVPHIFFKNTMNI